MKPLSFAALLLAFVVSADAGALENGSPRSYGFDNGAGLSGSISYHRYHSRHGDLRVYNGAPVSRFLWSYQRDGATVHYGGTLADDEQHYYSGLSVGPATVTVYGGEAESFSRAPSPLYRDLDHYFFHGGSRSRFEFRGAAADLGLPAGWSGQLAMTRIQAPGVDDRAGWYAGVAGRGFQAGVFRMDSASERSGRGLRLAWNPGPVRVAYQQLENVYGAGLRRLAMQVDTGAASAFSVALEQARNDLFAADNEQRIMFRFRKRLGSAPVLRAAQEKGDGGDSQTGFSRGVGIGVGLAAAAVAVSSGGGDDGVPRFAVRNSAARGVLNRINPVSVRKNVEHGGWVYRNADNTFSYTRPVEGTVSSVNIGNPGRVVPNGTVASASYHTHGGPDPRYDNENFSPQDLRADRLVGLDGYLGTPAGFMKLHDVETDTISVVGRINN